MNGRISLSLILLLFVCGAPVVQAGLVKKAIILSMLNKKPHQEKIIETKRKSIGVMGGIVCIPILLVGMYASDVFVSRKRLLDA